jgi:hypothetical protein
VAIALSFLGAALVVGATAGAAGSSLGPTAVSTEGLLPANEVPVLPSGTTATQCISQVPGGPSEQLPLEYGALQTNVYSPPAGTGGNASICYDAANGKVTTRVNWTHVGGSGGWFSYPQLAYGVDSYDGSYDTFTNQSAVWTLPQTVTTTESRSLWVTASYNYSPPSLRGAIGYDLSFDNYLSESNPPTFENGPFVEVLVLLDHHLVSHPAGWIPWNMTTLVDSTVESRPWYVGYWCHGSNNSSSPTVTFDFSFGGSAETTTGLRSGTIGVNMSAILGEISKLIANVTCWTGPSSDFSNFYLGQEVFGSEAGIHAGRSVSYHWTESRYCLHVNVTTVTSRTVGCSSTSRTGPASDGVATSAVGAGPPLLARRP